MESENTKWYKSINRQQRNALIGGLGGWTLDAMDVLLYIMSLTAIMKEFQIDTAVAGLLAGVTLFSSAIGGMAFGVIADYWGRKKALVLAILIYSTCTGLSGIATSVNELFIYRGILGLGMGGAWSTAALLVNESWPAEHRAKGAGFMQSGWAIGYMLAALLAGLILPVYGWRTLFFVGVIPGIFLVAFIIRYCEEPPLWLESKLNKQNQPKSASEGFSLLGIFKPDLLRYTVLSSLFVALVQFGYWGLATWLPSFLSMPVSQGGAGLSVVKSSGFVFFMQFGSMLGYILYGYLADWVGRKKAFAYYMIATAILVPIYGNLRDATLLFCIGPLIFFFGAGFFSGFGSFLSELFPTRVRGAAVGFVYNFGRGVSALAPYFIGTLAKTYGMGTSLMATAAFYAAGVLVVMLLPETKGKVLE